MPAPRVSIIMPAHNVQGFVGQAIASVAAQTYPSFELIVVNDGSTDATAEVLREARATWPLAPELLRIETRAQGSGASAARNHGVARAQGAFLAFIDADDRWMPETLAHLMAALEASPDSDIACPRYCRINEAGETINYLGEPVTPAQAPQGAPRHFDAGEALLATPAESATGVLVRRDAFAAGGGFDPALPSNNDIDCWLRILTVRGTTLVRCPQAVVAYRIRSAQITSDVGRMQAGHAQFLRNHAALLQKIGWRARWRHFGLVRAYWALLAARQNRPGLALRHWGAAVCLSPRLALPGTIGSSALFALAKAVLPPALWRWVSGLRRALRRRR